jgi:hypothetical protein
MSLLGLAVLVALAYRGWSVLLLAPAGALVAAAFTGEALLAHRTQTFMGNAARLVAQFFPLFLLGALFTKLMGDSGSVAAIADWMTRQLGAARGAHDGPRRRCGDLWRREPLRRLFRVHTNSDHAVPRRRPAAPADAGRDPRR